MAANCLYKQLVITKEGEVSIGYIRHVGCDISMDYETLVYALYTLDWLEGTSYGQFTYQHLFTQICFTFALVARLGCSVSENNLHLNKAK